MIDIRDLNSSISGYLLHARKEERVDREGSAGCPEGLRTRVSDRRLEGRVQRRVTR